MHRTSCLEGPLPWGLTLCSCCLEILNNLIFEFVFEVKSKEECGGGGRRSSLLMSKSPAPLADHSRGGFSATYFPSPKTPGATWPHHCNPHPVTTVNPTRDLGIDTGTVGSGSHILQSLGAGRSGSHPHPGLYHGVDTWTLGRRASCSALIHILYSVSCRGCRTLRGPLSTESWRGRPVGSGDASLDPLPLARDLLLVWWLLGGRT